MPELKHIPSYGYSFEAGPLPESGLNEEILLGNCRLLLQLYFKLARDKYFSKEELLNPEAILHTGELIDQNFDDGIDLSKLSTGTVIYGEKIANKNGEKIDFSQNAFASRANYLIRLHTAIFANRFSDVKPLIGSTVEIDDSVVESCPAILHATAIADGVAVWSVERFIKYYKPVSAKKFLPD